MHLSNKRKKNKQNWFIRFEVTISRIESISVKGYRETNAYAK